MKKIVLIIITLLAYTLCDASFPVIEISQEIEINNTHLLITEVEKDNPFWGMSSFILSILVTVVMGLGSFYILIGWLLALCASIFGFIGLKHKPNGFSFVGFILGTIEVCIPFFY